VALAKLHVLDASQEEALIELVEKLLADSSTLVLGSAVAALQEIAPNNYELLHGSFRKLCHLLADLDEWTQVSVLNMMQRYVRSQFTDPRRRDGSSRSKHVSLLHQAQQSGLSQASNSASLSAPKLGKKPGKAVAQKGFYSDDDSGSSDADDGGQHKASAFSSFATSAVIVPQQGSVFMGKDITIEYDSMLDPDHRLILSSSLALLKSRNSAVVLAVCALHFHCGIIDPQSPTLSRIAKAMVRIMKSRREIQYSVLGNIKLMALETPWMFQPFVQDFFVKSTDPLFNRILKLDILTAICSKENSTSILKELQAYVKDNNVTFIVASINAVAKVLEVNQENLGHGVSGLLDVLICHSDSNVHAACATALRHLLQLGLVTSQTAAQAAAALAAQAAEVLEGGRRKESDKKSKKHSKRQAHQETDENAEEASRMRQLYKSYVSIMQQAVRRLFISENKLTNPVARANLVWLAGEYYSEFRDVAKDILRLLAQGFCDEATTTKVQILNLAVKYSIRCVGDEEMESLMTYVLELSRYDISIEVRDLARLMTAVSGLAAGEEEGGAAKVDADALEDLAGRAAKILLATKHPPAFVQNSAYSISAAAAWEADGSDTKSLFLMGSISAMTGYTSPGYTVLPPWCDKQPDSSVRDQSASVASMLASSENKGENGFSNKFTPAMSTLDVSNFYDDDEREEKETKRGAGGRSKRHGRDSSSSSSGDSSSDSDSSHIDSSSASVSSESTSSSSGVSGSDSTSTSSSSSSDTESSASRSSRRSGRRAVVGRSKQLQGGQQSAAVLVGEAAQGAVQKRGNVQRVVRNRQPGGATVSQGGVSLLDLQFSGEPPAGGHSASDSYFSGGDLLDIGPSNSSSTTTMVISSNMQHFGAPPPDPLMYASPQHMQTGTSAPVASPASDTALLAQILDSFPAAATLTETEGGRAPQRHIPLAFPGNVSVDPTAPVSAPVALAAAAYVPTEVLGVPRQIINPDLSSGLSVSIAFRHGAPSSPSAARFLPGGVEAKRVVIRVENRGKDYPIRYICM
jgi:AP-3 complex subunit beta